MDEQPPQDGRVSFDGRFLVVTSTEGGISTIDFTENQHGIPEDWAEDHPEWLRDTAIGLAESYFELSDW